MGIILYNLGHILRYIYPGTEYLYASGQFNRKVPSHPMFDFGSILLAVGAFTVVIGFVLSTIFMRKHGSGDTYGSNAAQAGGKESGEGNANPGKTMTS